MNNREQLAALLAIIEDYSKVGNKAFADAYKLEAPRKKVLTAIIREEQLLAGDWEAEQARAAILQLRADEGVACELYDLLKPESHDNFPVWDDHTNIRFDDGVVRLELPTASALQFIRDHGLQVRSGELTRGVAKLTEQLRRLTEIVTLFEDLQ